MSSAEAALKIGWYRLRRRKVGEVAVLSVLVATAVFLRVYRLSTMPTGLRPDEVANAMDTLNILAGDRPVFLTTGYGGREVLFIYAQALSVGLLGQSDLALRVVASAFGIATILMTYVLARRLFSPRVSLLTVAWLALSLWHVIFSRIGLRTVSLAFFTALLMYCFWRGFAPETAERAAPSGQTRVRWFAATGLVLGLAMYTYIAARLLPLVIVSFLVYLWLVHADLLRRSIRYFAITLAMALIVVAPEAIYFANNPDTFVSRARGITSIGDDVASGHFASAFAQHVAVVVGMFNVAGDQNWDRNIPGRPLFDPLSSALMGIGLILAIRHWRKPAYALLLLWLTMLLVPDFFVAREEPNFLHHTGLIPAIYVLPALGADWLWTVWERIAPRALAFGPYVVASCAFALGAKAVYHDYFVTWAPSTEVAFLFDSDRWLTLSLARQEAPTAPGLLVVGAGEPDARLSRFALAGQPGESTIKVFNGQRSLPIPPPGTPVTYLFSARDLPPPDLRAADHGFTAATAIGSTLAGGQVLSQALSTPQPPIHPGRAASLRFGDSLEVTGFDAPTDAKAGDVVTVRWYWKILRPDDRNLTMFNQVLDETGAKRGQLDDRPFAPNYWPAGTTGVSWFDLRIDSNTQTGPATLDVGVYDPATMGRLPIVDARGKEGGDHLALGPIKVHGRPALMPNLTINRIVEFSDLIDLIGYSESLEDSAPNRPATLELAWRARGRPSHDYTVFVHLLDDNNQIVAQADSPPRGGRYPTSLWDEGEVISDSHPLVLPPTISAGTYHYAIGWYRPDTGARLAAADEAGRSLGDTVNLDGPTIAANGG
jgi:4-amino-4-deoxy-L-arabinose transferase-like glycosyltransferase